MLPVSLPLAAGVDVQRTPLQVGKGIVNSNLIRFRNGLIQKLGGCTRMSSLTFQGTARCLVPFQDLMGNHYLAIGTNQTVQLFSGGVFTTILPVSHTSNLTTPFSTTSGNPLITIADGAHTPTVGSYIQIVNLTLAGGALLQGIFLVTSVGSGTYTIVAPTGQTPTQTVSGVGPTLAFTTTNASQSVAITLGSYAFVNNQSITVGISTTVGGVTLYGPYTVTVPAIGVNRGTINAGSSATSSASASENSGNVQINYLMALPSEVQGNGGFGIGQFGAGAFGQGQFGGQTSSGSGLQGSQPGVQFTIEFSMDKWGENLVFCWITGTVYQWVPPIAANNLAAPVSGAPSAVTGLFVAAPQQQVMAWGAFSGSLGEQDPMLIAWCDVANLTSWTASTTNQAGSFRIPNGNLIVSGTWFGTVGLFWTEIELWSMSYIGFPLVYGFNKVAPNCGLIARRAWAALGTLVVWLSFQDFFIYQGGAVQPLTCTVRDFIFKTLDTTYLESIHADANTYGGEITWWFPQIGSGGVCTGAVKWHAAGGEWDITQTGLSISAWCDQSILGPPIGAFYTGLLEQFETSVDFDGKILDSYIVSGYFQIAEGEEFVFVERVYPDFNWGETPSPTAALTMTFYFADDMATMANPVNPGDIRTYGPYTITQQTRYVIIRGRGRVMQFRVDANSALNTFWRYGEPLMRVSIDGRR